MERDGMDRTSAGVAMLGAFAVGALVMYLLDPQQGNWRRALVRDKLYSASVKTRKLAQVKSRDYANRAYGAAAEARRAARKLAQKVSGATAAGPGIAGDRDA